MRRIHLPFASPFPQRIHLPFSLPFPFIVALAAGAGLRLVAMIGYPGALWFAGDSYVYLGAALRPQPNLSKTTGYSVFLHALEPFHSLTLVAGLQHLMGLAVAVMIYLLLRRNGVSQRWATAATLPVLLDGFVIEDEHMVMAEALFTFLVMVSMLLVIWRSWVPWPVALLAGLLAGCAVDVRSSLTRLFAPYAGLSAHPIAATMGTADSGIPRGSAAGSSLAKDNASASCVIAARGACERTSAIRLSTAPVR